MRTEPKQDRQSLGIVKLFKVDSSSNIWVYRWIKIQDRCENHPICPVRRTDDAEHCRMVNQQTILRHAMPTPPFNSEFSSLTHQRFVHCICSGGITSIQPPRVCRKNSMSTAVPGMYSVVKARYILFVGIWPEDWQDLPLICPIILLGALCAHDRTVMLEEQYSRDKPIYLQQVTTSRSLCIDNVL